MKKKVISMLLTAGMTLSLLSGCGSSAAAETAPAESTSEEAPKAEEAAGTAELDETPCTITYYTWAQSNDGAYPQNMLDAFMEKYPWITVDFQMGPSDQEEYLQAQKVKFLAGDGIDVTTLFPSSYSDYVGAGYLEEITEDAYLSAYDSSALDAVTMDGKIYGMPYAEDAVGIIYNKTMFEENGWEVPSGREEWLALCDTVAAAGITPMIQGVGDTWPLASEAMPFLQGLYASDPDIFTKIAAGEVKYTDQVFVDCFKDIEAYFNSNAVSAEAAGLSYDQAATYFATGKAAMACHGEWFMGSINAAEPEFEIGVFAVPTNKEGEKQIGAAEVGQYQAICASSENKEAAKLLLEYMSSKEGAQYFADSMSNFTAVDGVAAAGMEDWANNLAEETLPFYYDQMYTGASSELYKQLQLLYIGETSVEDALLSVQTAQEKQN